MKPMRLFWHWLDYYLRRGTMKYCHKCNKLVTTHYVYTDIYISTIETHYCDECYGFIESTINTNIERDNENTYPNRAK